MTVVVGKVTATINGQPVELENFKFERPPAPPRAVEPKEWTVEMRMHADEWARFHAAVLATWSRPRYWWRRRQHLVRRFRKHMARALGVSYGDMRHFCRTGKWPRSPMRLSVDPRAVAIEASP